MNPGAAALVLLAALLHASWNALLRSSHARLQAMVVMCATDVVLAAVALTVLWPDLALPSRAAWYCIAASTAIHVGYNLFLVRAYRTGDLGEAYPIARGSSPLLVTLGAALFAGERLSLLTTLGIVLVSGGIMTLALRRGRIAAASLPAALATGLCIAAYTVVDGTGVRLSGDTRAYVLWFFLCEGLSVPLILVAHRGTAAFVCSLADATKAAVGGLLSILAYGVVLWAMTLGPMGPVSALRETSVVFAALLGRLFLNETLTVRRVAACGVIALGAACLGYRP
ncbi:MAG TPA: DMT family transporter [Candidatus Sulfotelmatobacter sp.]|nr:DMT family transporter [Candidatus Sulfotelmatobacter sp.]